MLWYLFLRIVAIVYEGIGVLESLLGRVKGVDNLPHESVMFRYNVGVYVYARWVGGGYFGGFGRESV